MRDRESSGCPEYDERLIERATTGVADVELESHLHDCSRCRQATERYALAATTLLSAWANESAPTTTARSGFPKGRAVAVAALILVLIGGWAIFRDLSSASFALDPARGAVVRQVGLRHVAIDYGFVSVFSRGDSARVDTPAGGVTVHDADFTVEVGSPSSIGQSTTSVAVNRGSVVFDSGGDVTSLVAGERIVRASSGGTHVAGIDAARDSIGTASKPASFIRRSTIRGIVIREIGDRKPFADASILVSGTDRDGTPFERESRSDAAGVFSIDELPSEGSCQVKATAVGFAPDSRRVHLTGGPIEIGKMSLAPGVPIGGIIVAAGDGRAVPGAAVWSDAFTFGIWELVAHSDNEGRFAFSDPVQRGSGPHVVLVTSDDRAGWTEFRALHRPAEEVNIRIELQAVATLELVIADERRQPAAGVRVTAAPGFPPFGFPRFHPSRFTAVDAATGVGSPFEGVTDATGRVRFERLPAPATRGPYRIHAVSADGRSSGTAEIHLASGVASEESVVLEAVPVGELRGRVVDDEDGVPISGATVACRRGPTLGTDSEGRFTIPMSESGRVAIDVSAPGYANFQLRAQYSDRSPDDLVIELGRPSPIFVSVVDQHGSPVAEASVAITRPGRSITRLTGSDGGALFGDATRGEWALAVSSPHPLHEWLIAENRVVRGGDQDIRIVLNRVPPPRAKLIARVVDAETGQALDPVRAEVKGAKESASGDFHRDAMAILRPGAVAARDLNPGRWRIDVFVSGRPSAHREFDVSPEDENVELTVSIERAGMIVGRVSSGWTRSLAGAIVSAHHVGSDPANLWNEVALDAEVEVTEDGRFRIENLSPGRYEVKLAVDGFAGAETVEVPSGGEASLELELERVGRVVFQPTEPLPEGYAAIELDALEGAWRDFIDDCNPTGQWVAEAPPGRYRWRLYFRSSSDEELEAVEGDVDFESGESREVRVPIRRAE